jgi:AmmeMemoRadiSam system protein A
MALLDDTGRKGLLKRARSAIARAIGAEATIPAAGPIPDTQSALPDFRAGAFVTLRTSGHLRGCIGYPDPLLPLVDAVERCAVSAACADPRFPPVSVTEWHTIDLEISVLGPIEPVGDISEITIGTHGLIVEQGHRRGLLLPQVATEWRWDVVEFASHTCAKAGLPRDAWRTGARLFKFEAEVFGESD